MDRLLPTILGCLVAGTGAAFWIDGLAMSAATDRSPTPTLPVVADQWQAEVQSLERALDAARAEGRALRDELALLQARDTEQTPGRGCDDAVVAGNFPEWIEQGWQELAAREAPSDDRLQALIDQGFAPLVAEEILLRETQLQLEAAQTKLDAAEGGGPVDFLDSRIAARGALRAELGDYDYERYLNATGQATQLALTSVLDNSPAEVAGLQVGDTIVSYDGHRIFNSLELADHSTAGESQEPVLVEVLRDDVTMQFVVPRGTLGVTGGRPLARSPALW